MLAAGNPFPNFSLPNQDGKTSGSPISPVSGSSSTLSEGRHPAAHPRQVIYGYQGRVDAAGIKVVGVSAGDVTSHRNFSHRFAFKTCSPTPTPRS